jgi:hypothetical protein
MHFLPISNLSTLLIHLLTYSLTHLLTYSLTHLLTYSLTHPIQVLFSVKVPTAGNIISLQLGKRENNESGEERE